MSRKRRKSTRKPKSTLPRSTPNVAAAAKLTEKVADKMIDKPTPEVASESDISTASEPTLDTVVAEADLKKRELIDLVVERSGIKKKDAKPVVEAMLAVLGETIADGRELNLQPFGKLRINRTNDKPNGRVIVCKLRQSTAGANAPKEPLAEGVE